MQTGVKCFSSEIYAPAYENEYCLLLSTESEEAAIVFTRAVTKYLKLKLINENATNILFIYYISDI